MLPSPAPLPRLADSLSSRCSGAPAFSLSRSESGMRDTCNSQGEAPPLPALLPSRVVSGRDPKGGGEGGDWWRPAPPTSTSLSDRTAWPLLLWLFVLLFARSALSPKQPQRGPRGRLLGCCRRLGVSTQRVRLSSGALWSAASSAGLLRSIGQSVTHQGTNDRTGPLGDRPWPRGQRSTRGRGRRGV